MLISRLPLLGRFLGYRYRRPVPAIDLPKLTSKQQKKFRRRVALVDDAKGGLISAMDSLSLLYEGKSLSLWELERFFLAAHWVTVRPRSPTWDPADDDELEFCQKLRPPLEKALNQAKTLVSELSEHDELISGHKLINKQIAITRWSAVAAIASALAAIALVVLSYFEFVASK